MTPPGTGATPGGRWPPRLALLLVLVLATALAWREETSLDYGFHVATGRYILEHRAWPRTDPFTYTVADHPYIDMHGLTQIALALAEGAGGLRAVGLFRVAMILATTGILWAHAARRGRHAAAFLAVFFTLGLLAWEQRFFARPELATFLFLAVELWLLRRHAEDGRARWLYTLPVLQLAWVYAHALSLFGVAVTGLYAVCGLATHRRRDRTPWLALALMIVALALNPYGPRGIAFLWNLRTRLEAANVFAGSISELGSPFAPGTPGLFPFLAFKAFFGLGLLCVLASLIRRRLALFDLALVAVFLWLAATAVRNIGLSVVAALPVFLGATHAVAERVARPARRHRRASRRASLLRTAATALALAFPAVVIAGVLAGGYYVRDRRPGQFGSAFSPGTYPLRTVDFIVEHGLRGPLYNHLNFGGYLIGRLWPAERVYIDGRLEVIGEEFFAEYKAVNEGPGWAAMMRRHDPNLALVPHTSLDLVKRLAADPEWGLVEVDGVAALFLRARPENIALIAAAGARFAAENRPAEAGEDALAPRPRPPAIVRWFTPRRFPWEAWGRGNGLLGLGLTEAARREYRRALVESRVDEIPLVTNYAAACFRLGRHAEARAWYRHLLALDPGNRLARDRLATLGG